MDAADTDPTQGWVWHAEGHDYYRQEWDGGESLLNFFDSYMHSFMTEQWKTYWANQCDTPQSPVDAQ